MAKKVKRQSKIGLWWKRVSALPGEEPVLPAVPVKAPPAPRKEKVKIKDLKAAVDSINAMALKPKRPKKEEDWELNESPDLLEDQVSEWKKTGDLGLKLEPPKTVISRIDSFAKRFRKVRTKQEAKRWVPAEKVPFRPKTFMVIREKVGKMFERKRVEPHVKEIYDEVVERAEKVQKKDVEIEHLVKQLEE